jgi:HD-GYP domain-containing protein (c-di-GMP phosphodiesterase class II)
MTKEASFFSVRYDLILTEEPLPYDLFINSSVLRDKEKFIRIFNSGNSISKDEIEDFHVRYFHLYISEDQRILYLKSLVKSKADDVAKASVIKDAALEYLHHIFDKEKEFSTEVLSKNIEACKEVVESMVDVLDNHNIDSLRNLIGNLSFHDFYTFDHSINVSMYCIQIYKAFNPKAHRKELIHAGLGGLLHDLGKIKISTHILNKPGQLSPEEYDQIKKHPELGLDLLLQGQCVVSNDIDLKIISRVVHEHHENFDGTGYPNKLKGKDNIHLLARVCTIADFFDAITTKRAYNQVLSVQDAMNTLRKFRGIKLDPDIFDVFDRQVRYVRLENPKEYQLAEFFDPTLSYEKLPVYEIKINEKDPDFGKIKVVDKVSKKLKG